MEYGETRAIRTVSLGRKAVISDSWINYINWKGYSRSRWCFCRVLVSVHECGKFTSLSTCSWLYAYGKSLWIPDVKYLSSSPSKKGERICSLLLFSSKNACNGQMTTENYCLWKICRYIKHIACVLHAQLALASTLNFKLCLCSYLAWLGRIFGAV